MKVIIFISIFFIGSVVLAEKIDAISAVGTANSVIEDKQISMGINVGMGGYFGFECVRCIGSEGTDQDACQARKDESGSVQDGPSCLAAAVAIAQLAIDKGSIDKDKALIEQLEGGGSRHGSTKVTVPKDPDNPNIGDTTYTDEDIDEFIKDWTEKLKDAGYEYSNGVVKTPSGSASMSSLGNKGALGDLLGMSDEEVDAYLANGKDLANKLKDQVRVVSMGVKSGGGGYSGGRKPANYKDPFADEFGGKKRRANRRGSKKIVEGMTKHTSGGDVIGVSGDNIFRMIKGTYKKMRNEGYFVSPNHKFRFSK